MIQELRNQFRKEHSFLKEDNLFFINAGTSTGKTHTIVHNFIEHTKRHHQITIDIDFDDISTYRRNIDNIISLNCSSNLLFIFPLKNIFFLDINLARLMRENSIPILWMKSREDTVSTSSYFYMFTKKEKGNTDFIKNKDFFQLLSTLLRKQKNKKYYQSEAKKHIEERNKFSKKKPMHYIEKEQLPKIVELYQHFITMDDAIAKDQDSAIYTTENHRDIQVSLLFTIMKHASVLVETFPDNFLKESIALALALPIDIDQTLKLIKQQEDDTKFLHKLSIGLFLLQFAPIEVMKFFNSYSLLTTHKSIHNGFYSDQHPKIPEIKKTYFNTIFNITSNYSCSDYKEIPSLLERDNGLEEFITHHFYKKSNNYFYRNNIDFFIAIDEVHESYDIILENDCITEFNEQNFGVKKDRKINLIQSISALARWIRDSKKTRLNIVKNHTTFEINKRSFINSLLNSYSDIGFNSRKELEAFINHFLYNEHDIKILNSDIDIYNTLFQNITMLTPKAIINGDILKNTKIYFNNNYIIFSEHEIENPDKSTKTYSIMNLLLLVIFMIYFLRDIPEASLPSGNHKDGAQNSALYSLARQAIKNKHKLDNIFYSCLSINNGNILLNNLFTYFSYKTIFSIFLKTPDVEDKKTYNASTAFLNLKFITSLPEIEVLKNLFRKGNKVFLLSATQGYKDTFSGEFNHDFFHQLANYNNNIKINRYPTPSAAYLIANEVFKLKGKDHFYLIEKEKGQLKKKQYTVHDLCFNKVHVTKEETIEDIIQERRFEPISTELLALSAKKTSSNSIYYNNIYRKKEFDRVITAINHAINHEENAMIYGFSNVGIHVFREEFSKPKSNLHKFFPKVIKKDDKTLVFESEKIRFILYDAALNRSLDVEELLTISYPNQKIILISSFNSSSSGVNLIIEENGIKRDFDSLYIVDTMYYSPIRDENGFHNTNAHITALKHMSANQGNTLLDAAKKINAATTQIALKEQHNIWVYKRNHQTIGRKPRTLSGQENKIYFVSDDTNHTFSDFVEYNQIILKRHDPNRDHQIRNLSSISKSALIVSKYTLKDMAMSRAERRQINTASIKQYNDLERNLRVIYSHALEQYRKNNKDYEWLKEFNTIIRGFTLPEYPIQDLLITFISKHPILDSIYFNDEPYSYIINQVLHNIYIYSPSGKRVNLCLNKAGEYFYSDITDIGNGYNINHIFNLFYDRRSESFFYYNNQQRNKSNRDIIYTNDYRKLLNPGIINIIRGNIGEGFFREKINQLITESNKNLDGNFSLIKYDLRPIYEVFDVYIESPNKIISFDVKNYNPYYSPPATSESRKVRAKVDQVANYFKSIGKNKKMEFYYINANPDVKSVDHRDLIYNQNSAVYLNLFTSLTAKKTTEATANKQVKLNERIIDILKEYDNDNEN